MKHTQRLNKAFPLSWAGRVPASGSSELKSLVGHPSQVS